MILSTCGSEAMNSRVGSCQTTCSMGPAKSYKPVARRGVCSECTGFRTSRVVSSEGYPGGELAKQRPGAVGTAPTAEFVQLEMTVCPLGVGPKSCSRGRGDNRFRLGEVVFQL